MSAISYIRDPMNVALVMLPARMDSPKARAMLLAIGLQESRFEHRVQVRGPAHGFWQFEKGGGVKGVLTHQTTKPLILPILDSMGYDSRPDYAAEDCYDAIVHNDILACVFARLLLWTHPKPLPVRASPDVGWHYYLSTWRPGRPHRETWDDCFETAWSWVD